MEPVPHFTTSEQSFSMPSVRHNLRPTGSPTPGQSSRNNNVVAFHASAGFGSNTGSPSNGAINGSHREGRATNSRALLTSALEEAQTAVQLDHVGKTTAALDCYRRATAFLATAMQVSTSREELHRLQTIIDSYQLRIHVLAAKSMEPPSISRSKPFQANYSSSAPSADISPLQGATYTAGALNLASSPSRSHVTFQNPGTGGSQPASTSVAPLKTKRSVSSNNVLEKQDVPGEAFPRDSINMKGRSSRGRSHTLGALSRTPGDLATSLEPLQIPGRRTERNAVDYSSDSGSNSGSVKKRSRDLLLAKSTPIHLAPNVPLPPLPSDDKLSQPPATLLRPSAMLHSPPLSPKKSSRRISPLVPLTTESGPDAFSLTPVFHSNLPSPVSPRSITPLGSFSGMESKEAFSLTPEPYDDPCLQEIQTEEAISIPNTTPMTSREIFSLTPVFHNTQKSASPKPPSLVATSGASTLALAEKSRGGLLPSPVVRNGHTVPDSSPRSLPSQSKGYRDFHDQEGAIRKATAETPDNWLPSFSSHVAPMSDGSAAHRRRAQIFTDPLSTCEDDQDSITKELFAAAEVDRTGASTPMVRRNEPNSTIAVHFSTTFVNRKRREPRPSTTPVEPTKSFVLGGENSSTYNSDPLPQSKPGGPIDRAALFDRPLPPDPALIFSFPPGTASPAPELPKERRQIRRSWTLLDVIKNDPFQGANESYQRKVPSQEPAPTDPFLRCFWLMRRLEQTMTQGGFLSKRLYISPQVWYQQTLVRLPAVETKLQGCQQLAKMLDNLMIQSGKGIVTILIPGGAGVEQDQDRLLLLKELEALELTALQIWNKLSKKLSFIQKPDKHPGSMGLSASTTGGSVSTARSDSASTTGGSISIARSDSASTSSGSSGSVRTGQSRPRSPLSSLASGGTIAGAMFQPIQYSKPLPLLVYNPMDDDREGMETLGQKTTPQNRNGDMQAKATKAGAEPIERTLSLDSATPSGSESTSISNFGAFDLGESVASLDSSSSTAHSSNEKPSPPLPPTPVPKTSTWKRHLVRKSLDDFIRSRDRLPYDHSMFVPIANPKKAMASGGNSPSQSTKRDQGLHVSQPSSYGYYHGSPSLPGTDLLTNQFKNFSMSIQKSILYDKLEDTSVYTETIMHLFQSSYVLESMLKHYDSLAPFQTHLQLINKLRRLIEFLYFVVCPFVLQDLQELVPKYLKQISLSVTE